MDMNMITTRYADAVNMDDNDAASEALAALAHRVEVGERKLQMAEAIRLGLFTEYRTAKFGSGSPAKRYNAAIADSDPLDRKDRIFLAEAAGLTPGQVNMVRNDAWDPTGGRAPKKAAVTEPVDKTPKVPTVRTVVDSKKAKGVEPGWEIVKVSVGGKVTYELLVDGELVSEHPRLQAARTTVGKTIAHPVPAGHGVATNDPANMCPQGPGASGKK